MAKRGYNTFVVVDCKSKKIELVTSSARKSSDRLCKGKRIEVWNCNKLVERVYFDSRYGMNAYIQAEKDYHTQKQKQREHYNRLHAR